MEVKLVQEEKTRVIPDKKISNLDVLRNQVVNWVSKGHRKYNGNGSVSCLSM
jgi:hypothetical protein